MIFLPRSWGYYHFHNPSRASFWNDFQLKYATKSTSFSFSSRFFRNGNLSHNPQGMERNSNTTYIQPYSEHHDRFTRKHRRFFTDSILSLCAALFTLLVKKLGESISTPVL